MDFGPFLLLAILEGLLQAAVLVLMALGLSLVFGVMRVVNVAHGEFYMLGAITAWHVADLAADGPVPALVPALAISPLFAGVLALACERLVLRRLRHDPGSTIVATIGLMYIIRQSVLLLHGPGARPVEAPFHYQLSLPWFGYSGYNLFVIAAAVVLLLLFRFLLTRTRAGLVMRATQQDQETAQNFGIPVERVHACVFAAGAALAAIAAVLIVPVRQAHYLMGEDPLLSSFIIVILGGPGNLRGTAAAALLVGLADGIISMFFSPTLARMASTLLVALVLVLRPRGLAGTGR